MAARSGVMASDRERASRDFKRMMKWIALIAVLMVAGALSFLALTGDVTADMVIATTLGVSLSVLVGSGLMAASYFSDKSGHEQSISDATKRRDEP